MSFCVRARNSRTSSRRAWISRVAVSRSLILPASVEKRAISLSTAAT